MKRTSDVRKESLYALETLLRLAEANLVAGAPDVAERLSRQAVEEAPTVVRSAVIEARAQRLLGLVNAARGDLDSAREHLESSIRTCRAGWLRFV